MSAALAAEPDEPSLERTLDNARRRIQVRKAELDEARTRRRDLAGCLTAAFPRSRGYINGSVAHGDALTPLADVDVGVVVPNRDGRYGPGRRGPRELKEHAAEAIRSDLKDKYGDLIVEVDGHKRAILVRFRDPVAPGLPDFTADVIVAIDNPSGEGLYIPRWDSWDRSHPEKHTDLVLAAIQSSRVSYARLVRLVKHWSRRHNAPLCSWHIKALALGCLTRPQPLVVGLGIWFGYAADQLTAGDTADPAGVADKPIKTNQPKSEVLRRLRDAAARLDRAVQLEAAGYDVLAHDELARLFDDPAMLPRPDQQRVTAQEATRIAAEEAAHSKVLGAPSLITGTGAGRDQRRPDVRSWAP